MLDNIMLYRLTATAASSARLYAQSFTAHTGRQMLDVPVGVGLFPEEIDLPPRIRGERTYPRLFSWNRAPRGGHFAAFEQPALFTSELRACFASVRT